MSSLYSRPILPDALKLAVGAATSRAEYTLYRDPAWNKRLSPHITVAYLLHPPSQEEADSLVGALELLNDAFRAIEFEFSAGEVMYFSDMDNYSRV